MRGLKFTSKKEDVDLSLLEAVDRTQATIQFKPTGEILRANQNFLDAMGYTLSEIAGAHHSMFVHPDYAASPEYALFWEKLAAGEVFTDQFPRIAKNGQTVWIQATYAPIFAADGTVTGVIKLATDITGRQTCVESLAKALRALEAGNLCHTVPDGSSSDLNLLVASYNSAVTQLRETISLVHAMSGRIGQEVNDILGAADSLSQRTVRQAASLEEAAAAIQELLVSAGTSAKGAMSVERKVQDVKDAASNSNQVMTEALSAMTNIKSSSEEISKIVTVIDDISFQTNLLALNAGVEAARAGDSGKGFAVVASEVRGLAQRAAEAAGDIRQLISQSGVHVENGVGLVERVDKELSEIITSIGTIAEGVTDIAKQADEQSSTISEINIGVSELDTVTQQNAAMAEDVSKSTQALARNNDQLEAEVRKFEIGERDRPTDTPIAAE